jgi:hypothetical protein
MLLWRIPIHNRVTPRRNGLQLQAKLNTQGSTSKPATAVKPSETQTEQFNEPAAQSVDGSVTTQVGSFVTPSKSLFGDVPARIANSEPEPSKSLFHEPVLQSKSGSSITGSSIPSDLFMALEHEGSELQGVYKPETLAKLEKLSEAAKAPEKEMMDEKARIEPIQLAAGMQSLKSARFLAGNADADIYPEGIMSPNPAYARHTYDIGFLMQFKDVVYEKPSLDWDRRLEELEVGFHWRS